MSINGEMELRVDVNANAGISLVVLREITVLLIAKCNLHSVLESVAVLLDFIMLGLQSHVAKILLYW